jgi:ribonuclease HI
LSEIDNEGLQAFLDRLDIKEWDLLLVGDGSGSKWGLPIGWATVAIEKSSMMRKVFYGAMNEGTVNIAEAMAYMHAMLWYSAKLKAKRKKKATREQIVHVVTDSAYVETVGNRKNVDFSTNQPIWAVMELMKRQSIKIVWHHLPRENVALNIYADLLSKRARKLVKGNDQIRALAENGINADDANPWDE